jgi:hypothetical protein
MDKSVLGKVEARLSASQTYTTKLSAGLGLIEESLALLQLWEPGMSRQELYRRALDSGVFAGISAYRLFNIIRDGFAHRYLIRNGYPAQVLKRLRPCLAQDELVQLFFLYTCRALPVLADFVRQVYWPAYARGDRTLSTSQARAFIDEALAAGKTARSWSPSLIVRTSRYLVGACADFGLLEDGRKTIRRINPYRLLPTVGILLAHDLHFHGLSDGSLVASADWELFGLSRESVREELKQLAPSGAFLVQTAGELIRISWRYSNWEELCDAFLHG